MKQILFIILLFITANLLAQDYSIVDQKVRNYPDRFEAPEGLAKLIDADFNEDHEKVRALFYWLSLNVDYDMAEFRQGRKLHRFQYRTEEEKELKLKQLNNRIISNTLLAKKAVCEGYAQTFHEICGLLGIESQVITGFSKTDYSDIALIRAVGDHAWNAVKIDGKWKLLDATWSAGAAQGNSWVKRFNEFFYLTDPEIFILTHLPYDEKWQLLDKTIDQKTCFDSPVYKTYFFDYGMKLITPLQGKIIAKTNDKIKFTLENVPKDLRMFYAFRGDQYSQEIKRVYTGNRCTFEVPMLREADAVLYILALNNVVLTYKIEHKP